MYWNFDRFIFSKSLDLLKKKKNCSTNYNLHKFPLIIFKQISNIPSLSVQNDPLRKISKPSTYTYIYISQIYPKQTQFQTRTQHKYSNSIFGEGNKKNLVSISLPSPRKYKLGEMDLLFLKYVENDDIIRYCRIRTALSRKYRMKISGKIYDPPTFQPSEVWKAVFAIDL